jgi:hypothetical protein
MFFRFANFVWATRYAANSYLEKYEAAAPQGTTSTAQSQIAALYDILGVIDGKASALMTFDGIILAATSFSLAQPPPSMNWFTGSVAASGAFSLLSVIVCLAVVAIDWPFLGKVGKESGRYEFKVEIDSLKQVMLFRQDSYRAAWFLSFASVVFFLVAYGVYLCNLVR